MFLPPIHFADVEDFAVYPNQPRVQNLSADRKGFLAGRRIDSATYVLQKPGHYELPSVTIQWWDLRHRKLREHTVTPVSFDAAPNPNYRPEIAPPVESEEAIPPRSQGANLRQWAQWAGAALAILVALRLLSPTIRRYWTMLATRRAEQAIRGV